jgi:hypothetical protein
MTKNPQANIGQGTIWKGWLNRPNEATPSHKYIFAALRGMN